MTSQMSAEALEFIYQAMITAGGERVSTSSRSALLRIAKQGWAYEHDVEDLVQIADRRLHGLGYSLKVKELSDALGIARQRFCRRPRAISTGSLIFDGWTAFDAARMLIALEDLGFAIDPAPLVEALLPTIPRAGLMPAAALDVIWFAKSRGKCERSLRRENAEGRPAKYKDHDLPRGYRLTALIGDDGLPLSLSVRGPKYRRRAEPKQTACKECGDTWFKGDAESSLNHRREHKKRMKVLDPQPDDRVLAERGAGGFDELVTYLSPSWRHEEMYARALAFKRELHFDFTQWGQPDDDPTAQGFLLTDDEARIVGVCAFRYREYSNAPAGWALQFIWVAPKHRRRGVLSRRWPDFRDRFGDFHIEGPVSDAMQAFTRKMGDERMMFGTADAYEKYLVEKAGE